MLIRFSNIEIDTLSFSSNITLRLVSTSDELCVSPAIVKYFDCGSVKMYRITNADRTANDSIVSQLKYFTEHSWVISTTVSSCHTRLPWPKKAEKAKTSKRGNAFKVHFNNNCLSTIKEWAPCIVNVWLCEIW